jgi:hypothetical protein
MIRQGSIEPSAQAIPQSDLPVAGLQECATTPSKAIIADPRTKIDRGLFHKYNLADFFLIIPLDFCFFSLDYRLHFKYLVGGRGGDGIVPKSKSCCLIFSCGTGEKF